MISLSVLALLLITSLSSGSPIIHHDFPVPRQVVTNLTSIHNFVSTLGLNKSGTDSLLKTLPNNQDVKALLAGQEYDKSSLAHLSCDILNKTSGENIVSVNAIEQVIQESWSVDRVPPQPTFHSPLRTRSHHSIGQNHAG